MQQDYIRFIQEILGALPDCTPKQMVEWVGRRRRELTQRLAFLAEPPPETDRTLVLPVLLTLEQRIQAGGYAYVDSLIREANCPATYLEMSAAHRFRLFQLESDVDLLEPERRIVVTRFEPGWLHHLLALGAQYPELAKDGPIVAPISLGGNQDGQVYFAQLRTTGNERNLEVIRLESTILWRKHHRFLGVCSV